MPYESALLSVIGHSPTLLSRLVGWLSFSILFTSRNGHFEERYNRKAANCRRFPNSGNSYFENHKQALKSAEKNKEG